MNVYSREDTLLFHCLGGVQLFFVDIFKVLFKQYLLGDTTLGNNYIKVIPYSYSRLKKRLYKLWYFLIFSLEYEDILIIQL